MDLTLPVFSNIRFEYCLLIIIICNRLLWNIPIVRHAMTKKTRTKILGYWMRSLIIFLSAAYLWTVRWTVRWAFVDAGELPSTYKILRFEYSPNTVIRIAVAQSNLHYRGAIEAHPLITFVTYLGLPTLLAIQVVFLYQVIVAHQSLWLAQKSAWRKFFAACRWLVN